MNITFDEYWNQGGASRLQKRSTSSDVKESAEWIWNKALKHGRTDNKYVNMSFPEVWNKEGIGDRIDRKNRWSLLFKIDKTEMKEALREIWDDSVEYGKKPESSFQVSRNNTHLNVNGDN